MENRRHKKSPAKPCGAFRFLCLAAGSTKESREAPGKDSLEVHAAHAAHSAAGCAMRMAILLRNVCDHGFRRDQQTSNRSGVLQRATHDLSRVDDALLVEIDVLMRLGIVAVGGKG